MQLTPAPNFPPPAHAIAIGTISHPARRVPPLPMMSWAPEGTAPSWATLEDAIAGAAELTRPTDVPMLAIALLSDGRYAAHNVSVNMARPGGGGQRWVPWYLENVVKVAGPAVVDWSTTPSSIMALVDGPAVLRRRF